MQTLTEESVVTQKIRELCEAIVAQPDFRAKFQRIESFLADDTARGQYETVVNKGQALQEKQHRAEPLDGAEVAQFEKQREALLANPVARGFIEAQDQLHALQNSIQKQITKTLELGRVPGPDDLAEGSCGHGCGCH